MLDQAIERIQENVSQLLNFKKGIKEYQDKGVEAYKKELTPQRYLLSV